MSTTDPRAILHSLDYESLVSLRSELTEQLAAIDILIRAAQAKDRVRRREEENRVSRAKFAGSANPTTNP